MLELSCIRALAVITLADLCDLLGLFVFKKYLVASIYRYCFNCRSIISLSGSYSSFAIANGMIFLGIKAIPTYFMRSTLARKSASS